MYEQFFDLEMRPFIAKPEISALFWAPSFQLASDTLVRSVGSGTPLLLITGDTGSGKTTLLRHFEGTEGRTVPMALMAGPEGGQGLHRRVCRAFGWAEPADGKETLAHLIDTAAASARHAGHRPVLLVDDAHALGPDDVASLHALGRDSGLQVVLAGAPSLIETLRDPVCKDAIAEIGGDLHLKPFNAKETASYVRHRVRAAGGAGLFTGSALTEIHRITGGLPGRIDILGDLCLVAAMAEQTANVDRWLIDALVKGAHRHNVFAGFIRDYALRQAEGVESGIAPRAREKMPAKGSVPPVEHASVVGNASAAPLLPSTPAPNPDREEAMALYSARAAAGPHGRIAPDYAAAATLLNPADLAERRARMKDAIALVIEPDEAGAVERPAARPAAPPSLDVTPAGHQQADRPVPPSLKPPVAFSSHPRTAAPQEPPRPEPVPTARRGVFIRRAGAAAAAMAAAIVPFVLWNGGETSLADADQPAPMVLASLGPPAPASTVALPAAEASDAPTPVKAIGRQTPARPSTGPAPEMAALDFKPRVVDETRPVPRPRLLAGPNDPLLLSGLAMNPPRILTPRSKTWPGVLPRPPAGNSAFSGPSRPVAVSDVPAKPLGTLEEEARSGLRIGALTGLTAEPHLAEPAVAMATDETDQIAYDDGAETLIAMALDRIGADNLLAVLEPSAPDAGPAPRPRPEPGSLAEAIAVELEKKRPAPVADVRSESLAALDRISTPDWTESEWSAPAMPRNRVLEVPLHDPSWFDEAPRETESEAPRESVDRSKAIETAPLSPIGGSAFGRTAAEPEDAEVAIWTVIEQPPLRRAEPEPRPTGPGRVVLHYHPRNSARARALIGPLQARGFNPEMREIGQDIASTNIRYYYGSDLEQARLLSGIVAGTTAEGLAVPRDFTHYQTPPRRGTLELWLGD